MNIILPQYVRDWAAEASDEEIQEVLDAGLEDTIVDLEAEDFFGTEGFEKRFG